MADIGTFNYKMKDNLNECSSIGGQCCNGKGDDVFSQKQAKKLEDMNEYITNRVDNSSEKDPILIKEYHTENYCMSNADRMLGAMFTKHTQKNKFYYINSQNNKQENKISFSNKTASDRAQELKKDGWVHSSFSITFKVDETVMQKIQDMSDDPKLKGTSAYYKLWYQTLLGQENFSNISKLMRYLKEGIDNKDGTHIYYMTVSGDFHTLILKINNDQCYMTSYDIYDQHDTFNNPKTRIKYTDGAFEDVYQGIMERVSQNFTDACSGKSSQSTKFTNIRNRPPVEVKLWKVKNQ